jgi:cytochrome c oxidase cbb3-type subunit 3
VDIWVVTVMKVRRLLSASARVTGVLCCLSLAACARQEANAPAAGSPQGGAASVPGIAYEAHVWAGGNQPPGGTLTNPLASDPAAAKNGAALFAAMNCDGCHGGDASGWVAPSLTDGRWRYGGADGEVFSSIYFGRPKGMPAFGGAISPTAVWSLVAYLKSLPLPADVPTESFEN